MRTGWGLMHEAEVEATISDGEGFGEWVEWKVLMLWLVVWLG